jgi:hypothetical protein
MRCIPHSTLVLWAMQKYCLDETESGSGAHARLDPLRVTITLVRDRLTRAQADYIFSDVPPQRGEDWSEHGEGPRQSPLFTDEIAVD